MDQVLPPFFIALAAICLCGALYSLWQSLRGVFGNGGAAAVSDGAVGGAALPLMEEKRTVLAALRELKSERDLGKLSESDYEALESRYRERAKQVLRKLDAQLGNHRDAAQALVAETLGASTAGSAAPGKPASAQAAKPNEATRDAADAVADGLICGKCGVKNELDARFCKSCGAPMETAGGSTEGTP